MNGQTFAIKSFRDLAVYQLSVKLQQDLFKLSKQWRREESRSLTDQVRRSSRSIGANISEAWGKRRYPAHFLSKLTDADGELQETFHWLMTANSCEYLSAAHFTRLEADYNEVGGKLGSMMAKHEKFCLR